MSRYRTFLRGAGFASLLDPITRAEVDERRRKELEHQLAIRKQMEDRDKAKSLAQKQKMLRVLNLLCPFALFSYIN